jgi:hypothetical protein
MPKGGTSVRPTQITVRILEPVSTTGLTGRDVRKLRETVRSRIARALGQDEPATERSNGAPSSARAGSTEPAVPIVVPPAEGAATDRTEGPARR